MNGLDLALALLLLAPAAAGLWRGVLQPAATLWGVALGAYLGILYARVLSRSWFAWGEDQGWADLLVFALVLVGSMALAAACSRLLDALLRGAGLKWMDRIAGATLGAVIGLLAGAVLVVASAALLPDRSRLVESSLLAPRVLRTVREGAELLPDDLRERFRRRLRQIEEEAAPRKDPDAATAGS